MVQSELMGRHTHVTRNGVELHVWQRDAKFLARGRYERRPFLLTLSASEPESEAMLRQLMTDIENGVFVSAGDTRAGGRRRRRRQATPDRLTLRQLIDAFLAEKRSLRGRKTNQDYRGRLVAALEFAESPANRRRWPWCSDFDRAFAVEYRAFLHRRTTTGNGHFAGKLRPLAAGQIHNHLVCLGTALNWGRDFDANLLPAWFKNPFTHDVVGDRPRRDPLAPPRYPMAHRLALLKAMDAWQLAAFALSLVLANRGEDFSGLLISDLKVNERVIAFGTRFRGADFNKGRMSFHAAWPAQLDPIVRHLIGGRTEGPLILSRAVRTSRHKPKATATSRADVESLFHDAVARSRSGEIRTDNDRKAVFRRVLCNLGGASQQELAREFKAVQARVTPDDVGQFRLLRASTNTDMKESKMELVFRRYVTGHSLKGEILGAYDTQDLTLHMNRYFDHVRPLLDAIDARGRELGIA